MISPCIKMRSRLILPIFVMRMCLLDRHWHSHHQKNLKWHRWNYCESWNKDTGWMNIFMQIRKKIIDIGAIFCLSIKDSDINSIS